MKVISKSNNSYILRFDRGEDFIQGLQNFCKENGIASGWFSALGSSSELELAFFNINEKKYETKELSEFLEVITITGNLVKKEEKVFCHAHGVFGKVDFTVIGGHINKCIVSATLEVNFIAGDNGAERFFDEETGLFLLE